MSQLIQNTIQTNNKKQQPQDNSLNIFTEQIFTGQLFSLTISSMRILCSLCFYFLSKKETCHMESGVVSLVIIKLPYCLCGELVVSVELVTAYKNPGPPECAFSIKDQKRFFLSSLCCLCMYSFSIHVRILILCRET